MRAGPLSALCTAQQLASHGAKWPNASSRSAGVGMHPECCELLRRPHGDAEGEEGQGPARQQGLAGLFEPPHDILFPGSFEEAKEAAQGQSRWLVIPSSQILILTLSPLLPESAS